jgi:hypothetical protein
MELEVTTAFVLTNEFDLNRSRAQQRASLAKISYLENPEESEAARE